MGDSAGSHTSTAAGSSSRASCRRRCSPSSFDDEIADAVVAAIVDAARSGNESGDGIVWSSAVSDVTHNRTGKPLEEVEVG